MIQARPPSNDFRFDPEKHQYWSGEKRIPGVSEILQKLGLAKKYDGVDPFYRDRGTATHLAIKLHLEGRLDRDSLDEAVKPCFDAFLLYQSIFPLGKIAALEMPLIDVEKTFAGTPDLITDRAIFDWKCSKAHDKVANLQGQAYKVLAFDMPQMIWPLILPPFIVVELHDDGTFAQFDYGPCSSQWKSVMDLYKWKTNAYAQ